MRIHKSQIRDKCLSEKYYSSIKYMSHSLRGEKREYFIKMICDINIYLGCLCAVSCEENENINRHIWNKLNNYFLPHKLKYYDTNSKQWKENEKRLKSTDITNYLLACNVMGNIKAIKWYIHNHVLQKPAIIQLAKNMNESQLIDLLFTLYKSANNWDKIRGIGSTKNLYLIKNDNRVKLILKGLWFKDRDACVQLAHDTGWLTDLGNIVYVKSNVYVECLQGASKLLLVLELIEDALGTIEQDKDIFNMLIGMMKKTKEGEQYIYLIYLQKMRAGYTLTEKELQLIHKLPEPDTKIRNYFIPFFMSLVNGEYKRNINYFAVAKAFSKVCAKPNKFASKVGKRHNHNLELAIKNNTAIKIEEVLFFYFNTTMATKASLDSLFYMLNYYHGIQLNEFLQEIIKYPIWIRCARENEYFCSDIVTENYIRMNKYMDYNEKVLVVIRDYDYINKIFYSELYVGNILRRNA